MAAGHETHRVSLADALMSSLANQSMFSFSAPETENYLQATALKLKEKGELASQQRGTENHNKNKSISLCNLEDIYLKADLNRKHD